MLYICKDIINVIMETKNMTLLTNDDLWSRVYLIRGVQVMLDFDLAAIYEYETKYFNRQVNNNLSRFDEDFRFQLTIEEYDNLRCKNFTSSWGGTRYLPYAFTEEGIYMLMTVLKGNLAVNQSKKLIRLFKQMKNYIIQHQSVLNSAEMLRLLTQTQSNTEEILVAQKTIHIIDNYIGLKTLILLKSVSANVKVTIFSDNIGRDLHRAEFADFKREYPNVDITLKTTKGIYHDRYIIIDHGTSDEIIFHCGGGVKGLWKAHNLHLACGGCGTLSRHYCLFARQSITEALGILMDVGKDVPKPSIICVPDVRVVW